MTANFCRDCASVHSTTRSLPPFRWRCSRAPQPLSGPDDLLFVDPDWRPDPPYKLATSIRKEVGDCCPEFEPRKNPEP